jgi:hypothetical protein
MKLINQVKRTFIPSAIVLLGLSLFAAQASANVFDFIHGQVAVPGSELHALGVTALDQNDGKAAYFTNGKGRVLKVWATRVEDGTLRVTVQRVYIPQNYIAESHDDILNAEKLYNHLSHVAHENAKVGEYALLAAEDGIEAYRYGEFVASELDAE